MKLNLYILSIICFMLPAGCITHHVMDDYPQYLMNNENSLDLPKLGMKLSYEMDAKTATHLREIHAFSAGYANKWMIEFGKMLQATMESNDVKKAFKSIQLSQGEQEELHILFSVKDYDFSSHRASIKVSADVFHKGKKILSKNYNKQGISQGGKMVFAGAFGMKNAIQQSTKSAMDQILIELVGDIKRALKTPVM